MTRFLLLATEQMGNRESGEGRKSLGRVLFGSWAMWASVN